LYVESDSKTCMNDAHRHVQELHDLGYQNKGFERMYSGFTGRPLEALVFLGPTYYQRLKHMVDDKVRCRCAQPAVCRLFLG
jgi:DNA-directed RNA polymerase beta subunit